MRDQRIGPEVWMLLGALTFATMGAFTHALGSRCDWLIVAFVRAAFMFVATAGLAWAAGVRLVVWQPRTLWVRSLAGSFSLVCNFYALTRLPIADALTLSNTYPLWIVVLTAFLLRSPPTVREIFGVASGMFGVYLIQQPHLGGDRFAAGVALVSAFSTAVAMLGLHRLRHIDTRAIVAHFAGVASLISLVWLAVRPEILTVEVLRPTTLLLLLGVALTGTVGQFCLTRAYTHGSPARMSIIGLSQVVFAMGFDVVLWQRTLTAPTLIGFLLVLAPTAFLGGLAGRKLSAASRTASPPREDSIEPIAPPGIRA